MSKLLTYDPSTYDSLEDAFASDAVYACNLETIDATDKYQLRDVLTIIEATADNLSHKHRLEAFILDQDHIINIREVIYGRAN